MDTWEDDLQYLLDHFNQSDYGTDPTYLSKGPVQLCSKTDVNTFGSAFVPAFYLATFVLGCLGNGLVLVTIVAYEKLQSVTNVFLLNLVMSNLIFAASLPFWAAYHRWEWLFGRFMCKAVSSAYMIGYNSSILFLTLITFDRYLAVVHAVAAAKSRKKLYAVFASVVVWAVSIAASIKDILLRDVQKNPQSGLLCEDTGYSKDIMNRWRFVSTCVQFSLFFMVPLCLVMFCYASITARILATQLKEKCRTIKLIFVIIFTFFVFWTPYNIVCLLRVLKLKQDGAAAGASVCEDSESLDYALYVTRNLAYLYCGVSPVFYTFVGKKFQSHFRRLLGKYVPCLKRRMSLSSHSSVSIGGSTKTTSQRTHNAIQASAFSIV
ncbi:unnamed protein product [Knipowitschia caucasica]